MAIGPITSVTDLIPAYKNTRKNLEWARSNTKDKADRETLGSMISDCDYTLEWLQSGRRPGSLRGVERRYERSWDPHWIDAYHSTHGWSVQREGRELSSEERFKIEEAMRDLTPREKQCYMLSVVDGMSLSEIAQELHLGKSTVQTNIDRAKKKIEWAKMTSLFLAE